MRLYDTEYKIEDYSNPEWRWKNFTLNELKSKGDNLVMFNEAAMDRLQALRDHLGIPLHIVSAYRSVAHNKAVGGKPHSMHLQAKAFDISLSNFDDPNILYQGAIDVGFHGFGFYQTFFHTDIGRPRYWNQAPQYVIDYIESIR